MIIIRLVATANFLDVQRIVSDIDAYGWGISAEVELNGTLYVDGIPKSKEGSVADFVMNRSRWVIDSISDSTGACIA